jgi:hypothetical protein
LGASFLEDCSHVATTSPSRCVGPSRGRRRRLLVEGVGEESSSELDSYSSLDVPETSLCSSSSAVARAISSIAEFTLSALVRLSFQVLSHVVCGMPHCRRKLLQHATAEPVGAIQTLRPKEVRHKHRTNHVRAEVDTRASLERGTDQLRPTA